MHGKQPVVEVPERFREGRAVECLERARIATARSELEMLAFRLPALVGR